MDTKGFFIATTKPSKLASFSVTGFACLSVGLSPSWGSGILGLTLRL